MANEKHEHEPHAHEGGDPNRPWLMRIHLSDEGGMVKEAADIADVAMELMALDRNVKRLGQVIRGITISQDDIVICDQCSREMPVETEVDA